jgi:transcriptional regulator with XRE-family HTH domain
MRRQTIKIKNLPTKLRDIRRHLGLSQSQLAARLRYKPHYSRVSEFELGRRTPNLLTLLDYAQLGGIHIDDLIDDEVMLNL